MKIQLFALFMFFGAVNASVLPLLEREGFTQVTLAPATAQTDFQDVVTNWYTAQTYSPADSIFTNHCMLGFVAFMPTGSTDPVNVYMGKKCQDSGAATARDWRAVDCPCDDHMHTERQLVHHVLSEIDPATSGDLYLYVESAPCQTPNYDNGSLSCVQYYNAIADQFSNVRFHIFFPSDRLALDPENAASIPDANAQQLFGLLKPKARKIRKGELKPFVNEIDKHFQQYQHDKGDPYIFQFCYKFHGFDQQWHDVRVFSSAVRPLVSSKRIEAELARSALIDVINSYIKKVCTGEEALQVFTILYPRPVNLQYILSPSFRERVPPSAAVSGGGVSALTVLLSSLKPAAKSAGGGFEISRSDIRPVASASAVSAAEVKFKRVNDYMKNTAHNTAVVAGKAPEDYFGWVSSLTIKKLEVELRPSGIKLTPTEMTEIFNKLKDLTTSAK